VTTASTGILTPLATALAVATLLIAGASAAEQRDGRRRGGPPPEALEACADASQGADCGFIGRRGEQIVGTCEVIREHVACVPEGGPPPRHRDRRDG